jgi:hypothetical protein
MIWWCSHLSIKCLNSTVEILLWSHSYKAKSSWTPSFSIVHDCRVKYVPMLAEQVHQPRFFRLPWQVANISPESRRKLSRRSLHTGTPLSCFVYIQKSPVNVLLNSKLHSKLFSTVCSFYISLYPKKHVLDCQNMFHGPKGVVFSGVLQLSCSSIMFWVMSKHICITITWRYASDER